VLTDHNRLSLFERLLTLFTRTRPGEGRSTLLFALHVFLLLFSYYIVKALREGFMLTEFSAEVRSYAVAAIALLLMFIVPAYAGVRRRLDGVRLLRVVTVFFAANLLVFAALAGAGVSIGFAFFVWVGIFGVMVIAQFWAFAADTFNLKSGQRLFPVIMLGGNLGALVGVKAAEIAVENFPPLVLMVGATATLLLTIAFVDTERAAVPAGSRAIAIEHGHVRPRLLGGIELVLRDRYLLLIALLIVLLNWVNSTGEYILADVFERTADARVAASGGTLGKQTAVTMLYADFQFWVTLVGLLVQLFLVSRVFRAVGVRGALLVLPVVSALAYGLVLFLPIFSMIRIVKIAENSLNYTLMNTANHALYLPVSRDAKYDGKTAIDTFFVRFGDLLQAGLVFIGLNVLDWDTRHFAITNLLVALAWLGLALAIGREFRRLARENQINVAPQPGQHIPDLLLAPGSRFAFAVPTDAFTDADPGDVLRLHASLLGGEALPEWCHFDAHRRAFAGVAPAGFSELQVIVTASDVDGLEAQSRFAIRPA
jgi:AAA family ATP:ADP antiporter